MKKRLLLTLLSHFACCIALILCGSANAATLYFSSNLDSGAGMALVGDPDTAGTFGFDYSVHGIPEAPNNVGGAATTGLKMQANIANGVAAEVAAVTTGLGATVKGKYSVQVDIWANFAIGDGAATEFAGAGVGHDGVATGRNGASLFNTGDGGSSRDYRLYKNDGEQFLASGQYAVASNNGSDAAISAAFPATAPPGAQGQAGTSDPGDSAFQWYTMLIEVDSLAIGSGVTTDPGLATFTITSAQTGTSVEIGTIDNSNGGDVVNMTGNASLIYGDLFSSLNGVPALQFGIYDNLIIQQIPEPASMCLLGIASLGMLLRRSK